MTIFGSSSSESSHSDAEDNNNNNSNNSNSNSDSKNNNAADKKSSRAPELEADTDYDNDDDVIMNDASKNNGASGAGGGHSDDDNDDDEDDSAMEGNGGDEKKSSMNGNGNGHAHGNGKSSSSSNGGGAGGTSGSSNNNNIQGNNNNNNNNSNDTGEGKSSAKGQSHSQSDPSSSTTLPGDKKQHKNTNNTTATSTNTNTTTSTATTTSAPAPAAAPATPAPVLKGTLSYISNELTRKHTITGLWNFETLPSTSNGSSSGNINNTPNKPQRFELNRTLGPTEDPTELPKDGTFSGSFSLIYSHISAKGKRKEKTKVISESGVKIKFTERLEGYIDKDGSGGSNSNSNTEEPKIERDCYDVRGEGNNQYGVFSVIGVAWRDRDSIEKRYKVELRKRYLTNSTTSSASSSANAAAVDVNVSPGKKMKNRSKKRKLDKTGGSGSGTSSAMGSASYTASASASISNDPSPSEPLPPPSKPHPTNVICLRGKIDPRTSAQDGVVHEIRGLWSDGLNQIENDPQNLNGFCNEFSLEYRGTVSTDQYPISGKYSGWFNLTGEDGTRNRIPERDVMLKFKKNNAGYWNVEGRGTNMFGKYTISGTLDHHRVITIFRHFVPQKVKKAPVAKIPVVKEEIEDGDRMTLDDVKVPASDFVDGVSGSSANNGNGNGSGDGDGDNIGDGDVDSANGNRLVKPINTPEDGQYNALSRVLLRINDDLSIACSNGKWADSRAHFNRNIVQNFNFGLESHHAKLGVEEMKAKGINGAGPGDDLVFPIDSANYKGSFRMKHGTTKPQNIIDTQVVMKFRKNTAGSYNVYGKGKNQFGTFNLVGTLILQGRVSGMVELYRIYLPKPIVAAPEPPVSQKHHGKVLPTAKNATKKAGGSKAASAFSSIPAGAARQSSRATKLPSRLEEDDPKAMKARMMDKCANVLKLIRDHDIRGGSFFLEPVDPVAHGIPTYHQIITNPMDLGTIQAKMDANEIGSPEEFARLMRLIFDNAIKFNVDPAHVVHQRARTLLTLFNNKIRDVERMMVKKKPTKKELKELKKKQQEEQKRLEKERKRKREEEEDPTLKKIRLMHSSSQLVSDNIGNLKKIAAAGMFRTNVTREEFNIQTTILENLSTQVLQIQGLLGTLIPRAVTETAQVAQDSLSALPAPVESMPPKKTAKRKKPAKVEKVAPAPVVPVRAPAPAPAPAPKKQIVEVPLTLEEQQDLTEAIEKLSSNEEKVQMVINIIKEAGDLADDEEEVDLDIDQLSTATQRKLQRFVNENKPKPQKRGGKKAASKRTPASTPTPAPAKPEPEPEPKPKPQTDSFQFPFGSNDDDSDSDDEEPVTQQQPSSTSAFQIDDHNEDDDSEDEDAGDIGWKISETADGDSDDDDAEEDDLWAKARGAAKDQKAQEEERKTREAKMRIEKEQEKERNLAESRENAKKKQEERRAMEEENERRRLEKEREERERAERKRDEAVRNLQNIKATVNMEEQRDIMKDLEESYMYDKDSVGGASPSSDFGF